MSDEKTTNEKEPVWTEEVKVAGEDLLKTVKEIIHEAAVRRIVVRNAEKRIFLEIPVVLGVAGIALFPAYAAIAAIAALVTDCSIIVERVGDKPESTA